jgi:hypothetical protein
MDQFDLGSAGINGRNHAPVSSETNEGGILKGIKHLKIPYFLTVIALALLNVSIQGMLDSLAN